jgi:hypothetical protein
MKIDIQEKIAELESRIVELEKKVARFSTVTRTVTTEEKMMSSAFGEHWRKLWMEFHEVMKSAFGRDG